MEKLNLFYEENKKLFKYCFIAGLFIGTVVMTYLLWKGKIN